VTAEPGMTPSPVAAFETPAPTVISELSAYAFPVSIDPSKQYLFTFTEKSLKNRAFTPSVPIMAHTNMRRSWRNLLVTAL